MLTVIVKNNYFLAHLLHFYLYHKSDIPVLNNICYMTYYLCTVLYVSVLLSVCLFVCLSVFNSVCLFVCRIVCFPFCLLVCFPFVRLSVFLLVCSFMSIALLLLTYCPCSLKNLAYTGKYPLSCLPL